MVMFSLSDVLGASTPPCEPHWTDDVIPVLGGVQIESIFHNLTLRQMHERGVEEDDLHWMLWHMQEKEGLIDRGNLWLAACRDRANVLGAPVDTMRAAIVGAKRALEASLVMRGPEARQDEAVWQFAKLLEVFDD